MTEELRQTLWELEEEKEKSRKCDMELEDEREKRRCIEEEMNLKAHEQHNLKNKLSALLEEREKENEVMLRKEEETSLLLTANFPSVEAGKLDGELMGKLQMNHDGDPAKLNLDCTEELQTLQVCQIKPH